MHRVPQVMFTLSGSRAQLPFLLPLHPLRVSILLCTSLCFPMPHVAVWSHLPLPECQGLQEHKDLSQEIWRPMGPVWACETWVPKRQRSARCIPRFRAPESRCPAIHQHIRFHTHLHPFQ